MTGARDPLRRIDATRVVPRMRAFLDFEASSLGKQSYPIEVAWVFEDDRSESHLIRPAPGWDDWDPAAEAIHRIDRATLLRDGAEAAFVAERMIEALDGHALFASAPSWDGKWLSVLLRAAGRPRHALRLTASEEARRETAAAILAPAFPAQALADTVETLLTLEAFRFRGHPARHRALADAEQERERWLAVRVMAQREVALRSGAPLSPRQVAAA